MKNFLALSVLAALSASLHAVTFNLDAESLKTADGSPMPTTGLVVLTAGISGVFFGPTQTTFSGGDELVLKKWNLSAFSMAGVISDTTGNLSFTAGWNEGDPLRLYWYPTLTIDSLQPGAGTMYGSYTDSVGIDGSDAWITSGESGVVSLKFFTSDAMFLSGPGSNSEASGRASALVVPEPSAVILFMAAGSFLVSQRRRPSRPHY